MKQKISLNYKTRLLLGCILFLKLAGVNAQTLAHSYNFRTGSGTTITDNNNGAYQQANGTLTGTVSYSNGGVTVASSTTSNTYGYVAFDATKLGKTSTTNGLAGYTSGLTIEAYLQAGNATNASRYTTAAYFGGATAGKQCIWMQTCRNDGGVLSNLARLETNNNTTTANISSPEMDDNKLHHLVAVLRTDSLLYYVDGALVGRAVTGSSYITNIGTSAAYLFRSVYNDPNWNGTIFEFNIYDGVLTRDVVLQHAQSFFQSDANYNALQSLSVSGGGYFTSGFYPQKTDYQLILPPGATSLTLNATAYNSSATISGAVSGTGSATATIPVSSDYGTTTVTLTSQNGTYSKTYTIKYCRNLSVAASYNFNSSSISGTTVNDVSGNGANATLVGSAYSVATNGIYTVTGTGAGSAGTYLSLPAGTGANQLNLSSYPAITIESFIKKAAAAVTNQSSYLWYFGATGTGSTNTTKNGTQYFDQLTYKALYNPTTRNNTAAPATWSFEQGPTFTDPALNTADHYVTVLENDTLRAYLNGSLVGTTLFNPANLGVYANSLNTLENISSGSAYLGRSGYTADYNWCGSYGEVNIYRGVMTASTVTARATSYLKDATLSAITLSVGSITFDPNTTSYTVSVPSGTTSVTVGATTSKDFATITGAGTVTLDGSGNGTATLIVTSADGTTQKTYIVTFGVPIPTLTTSLATLNKLDEYTSRTFTVVGANLQANINIAAPVGFSVSPTSITPDGSGIVSATTITVTYTGTGVADWSDIIISSTNAASKTVKVRSAYNGSCFTPAYSDKTNLVTDPYMNSLSNYTSSWGSGATIDTTTVYCGLNSGKLSGTRAGSITYNLASIWKPNTKYRLRAKIYTPAASTFNFYVSGWSGASGDIGANITTSAIAYTTNAIGTGAAITAGNWNDVDFTFTTGTLSAVNQYFYFNNFNANNSGTSYIDNIELYEIERYATSSANLSSLTSANSSNAELVVNAGNELTVDANNTLKTITVNPLGKLTIPAGKSLTATNIVLNSDATGTATFVDNGTTTVSNAVVNEYMTSGRNWYVSSPVTAATTSNLSLASSILYYDESTSQFKSPVGGATLDPLKGYISVATTGTGAISYSGTLNTGNLSTTLTRQGATKSGFNLVGNPYPSYLDWSLVAAANSGVMSTMWFRTKTAADAYTFDTYNAVGQIGTNLGATTVTNLIPPMQAYWVRVNEGLTSTSFNVTNAMRSHADVSNNKLKAPAAKAASQQLLRLSISNGTNNDEAVIYFDSNASNGFDTYDSPKMSNANVAIPEIYTLAQNEQLVINGLNSVADNAELPLGFYTGTANTFTLKATQLINLDNVAVVLRDNVLNTEEVLNADATYTFSSDVTNTTSRFSLLFRTTGTTTGVNVSGITNTQVYVVDSHVAITSDLNIPTSVAIYNSIGQKVRELQLSTNETRIDLPSGVYVVNVCTAGKSVNRKIVLN